MKRMTDLEALASGMNEEIKRQNIILAAYAEEIRRLREALEKVDRHLTNLQPHIANLAPPGAGFIDPHVDCALEAARAALNQKE
jgi:uncharacterized coiled-coil protein SlyX